MNHRIFQLFLLVLVAIFLQARTFANTNEYQELPEIPAFIEKYRNNRTIILSTPEYDRKAKVYFLYCVSGLDNDQSLKQRLKHLAPAVRRIKRNGAELIVHLRLSEGTIAHINRNNNHGSLERQIDNCGMTCILVNSYEDNTAEILLKDSRVSAIGGGQDNLVALDAHGNLLATYYLDRGSVTLQNTNTDKETRIKVTGDTRLWAGTAIIDSYKRLVADRQKEEYEMVRKQEKAERKRRKAEEQEQLKIEQRRKEEEQKARIPRWKRVKTGS